MRDAVHTVRATMSQPAAQISARELYRSFKMGERTIQVLRGITLDITPGESLFLCGASGAGKSTLLYTLAGLERPEKGVVKFGETDVYAQSERNLAKLRNTKFGSRKRGPRCFLFWIPACAGSATTAGSWELYFDGSAVALKAGSEDLSAITSDADDLFLNVLSRYPSASEMTAAQAQLKTGVRTQSAEDLLWSLYNKVDFIFNY